MAPAAPTLLPSPPPITDRIALGALTHTFPPELVDRVVAALESLGPVEVRERTVVGESVQFTLPMQLR